MNKVIATGALAAALIIGGGTGVYMVYAKDNAASSTTNMMQHQGVDAKQMSEMMKSSDSKEMQQLMKGQNITFEQMKPYMQKMHPKLSDQQLEDLYNSMHGTGGACSSQNDQGMMQNTSTNL